MPSPSAPANPDGCPAPDEPISFTQLPGYGGDASCFPAGVTVIGWWQRHADGSVTIGPRDGSTYDRAYDFAPVAVSLRAGQTLPSDSGYGALFATAVGDHAESIIDATITPLPNPATSCPTTSPLPLAVYLDSLTSCWQPGEDVTIEGWRDTLDGLCGCDEAATPPWLTSQYGFGWLFEDSRVVEQGLGRWLDLYAPKVAVLGADSGRRPTYMEVTGHFDDPAARTCTAKGASAAQIDALRTQCASRFVVTSLQEVTPPAAALAFCPGTGPLKVADVVAPREGISLLEELCFGGHDITVVGWFDPTAPQTASTTYAPDWFSPVGKPALWADNTEQRIDGSIFQLFVDPGGPARLPTSAGWFAITGHVDDPAAATCVRTDEGGAGMDASGECASEFVVTGVAPAAGSG